MSYTKCHLNVLSSTFPVPRQWQISHTIGFNIVFFLGSDEFWKNSIEYCCPGFYWLLISIGLDNGVLLCRQQTIIIWINDGPVQWPHYPISLLSHNLFPIGPHITPIQCQAITWNNQCDTHWDLQINQTVTECWLILYWPPRNKFHWNCSVRQIKFQECWTFCPCFDMLIIFLGGYDILAPTKV